MDLVKSSSSVIRSNSKMLCKVFIWSIVFLMLPIDSMLSVNVQGQVVSPLRRLLSSDLMKIVLTFVFYLIACCNDPLLLILYLCLLRIL